tara:strand:+ start:260 stop:454 length:195 start_codon:yes stop_codon:yes gene_type:complete
MRSNYSVFGVDGLSVRGVAIAVNAYCQEGDTERSRRVWNDTERKDNKIKVMEEFINQIIERESL